jgi:hypothetical protein
VHSLWALGDFAEAAARTARTDEARKILDEFRPASRDSVAPWCRVALRYADALLADDDQLPSLPDVPEAGDHLEGAAAHSARREPGRRPLNTGWS